MLVTARLPMYQLGIIKRCQCPVGSWEKLEKHILPAVRESWLSKGHRKPNDVSSSVKQNALKCTGKCNGNSTLEVYCVVRQALQYSRSFFSCVVSSFKHIGQFTTNSFVVSNSSVQIQHVPSDVDCGARFGPVEPGAFSMDCCGVSPLGHRR